MIFTECPYCDKPQAFAWGSGDPTGYFPSRCRNCGGVMWVETTSFGGVTRTTESFKKEVMRPGDEQAIDAAVAQAGDQCSIVKD
jgi:hypothetical protein